MIFSYRISLGSYKCILTNIIFDDLCAIVLFLKTFLLARALIQHLPGLKRTLTGRLDDAVCAESFEIELLCFSREVLKNSISG
jgi:hypothetical protein